MQRSGEREGSGPFGDDVSARGEQPHGLGCVFERHGDRLVEPASVVFLCFEERWYRLYFDGCIIYWRTATGEPEPFEAPELDSAYPVVDVAQERNLRGKRLVAYRMEPLGDGVKVTFAFENGSRLAFRDDGSRTTYTDG